MGQTILSVGGDSATRFGRNAVLRGAGFEILETGTATDAPRLALEHQPTLIVLAIDPAGPDGFAVCKQLKFDPRTAAIPVLLLSRGESPGCYLESLESGADGYLHEPVEPPVLVGAATALIRRQTANAATEQAKRDAFPKDALAALIDSIPDEVWFADTHGRFTLANPSALREFRMNAPNLGGVEDMARSLEVFRADGTPRPVEEAPPLRALAGETVRSQEEIVRTPVQGELRYRQVSASPVRDAAGSVVGAVCVVRDITDRKRAEAEVAETGATLKAALGSLSDAVFITDAQGRFIHANDAFATYHRFGSKEECSKTFADCSGFLEVFFPDGAPAPVAMWAVPRALRGEAVSGAEYRLRRKDTGETWVGNYTFGPIRGKEGAIVGAVVAARDFTDRKKAEEALRDSEERFHALVTASSEVVYRMSPDWSEMRHLRGRDFIPDTESPSQTWLQRYLHPEDRPRVLEAINEAIRTGSAFELEHRVLRVDGSPGWMFSRAIPVRDANGEIVEWFGAASDITGRKQAVDALAVSESRLRALLESASQGVVSLDESGRMVLVNAQTEEMFGYTRGEMLGQPLEMLIPERYRAAHAGHMRDYFAHPDTRAMGPGLDLYGRSKDGHEFPIEVSLSCIEQGGSLLAMALITDVSQRKLAEERVRRSQRTFSELVERAPFGIYIVDSQFRIAHMNAGSQGGAFRNVRPVIGRYFGEVMRILWPEPVAAEIVAHFRHTLETGEPYYSPPFFNPRHDVEAVEGYEWELHRMTLPDGQFGVICYYFDSTQLRQTEAALRASESRLRTLTDNLPEGAVYRYRHDAHGQAHVDFISAGIERLTGVPAAEFMTDAGTLYRAILPEDHQRLDAAIALSRDRLEQFEVEVRHPHRVTGEIRWSLLRSTPTRHPDGAITWEGIELDITERQRAAEALRENQAQLAERTVLLERTAAELEMRNREVERVNAMKTEFLRRISHELRTPLNAIIGYSDLLGEQADGPLPPPYPRFVANIQEGASHLLSMVNDLLDISKIEAGRVELNLEAFRPAGALEDVLSVVTPLARMKNIAIDNQVSANISIRADRTRFKQVFYNLLSNAVKFTPENGRVWIADASTEDTAAFCVGDTGIGIPESELEAVFDEFHQVGVRAGEAAEGTGLGLAITRRLVELHGGAIRVESTVGQGSRFVLSLGPHSLK